MSFKTFIGESGLKILAMARLNQCEYSIMLYLLNCAASGLDEFITNEKELSSLIGYDEKALQDSLMNLAERNLVLVKHGDHQPVTDRQSIRIGVQYDMNRWLLNFDRDVTSQDAVVFPFRRADNQHLVGVEGGQAPQAKLKVLPTWQRVMESFSKNRNLGKAETMNAQRDAQILVETHPVDQVLLMLRHFDQRIPTLSLLASSWQHYQEVFEEETQKVDLLEARQKHIEQDARLRETVASLLAKKDRLKLTEEEVTVLEILESHRHPRRQLFWAYQTRSRYLNWIWLICSGLQGRILLHAELMA